MRLATKKNHTRDGKLVFVSADLKRIGNVGNDVPTMQYALDHWEQLYSDLQFRYKMFDNQNIENPELFKGGQIAAPLPRAYQWLDGSAYVHHVELARKSRGAVMPESFWVEPLMYQGGSDTFLGAEDNFELIDEKFGLDLEAEIGVIVRDVPLGVSEQEALQYISLIVLLNDWSYRELIPAELQKGFGFVNSKPSTGFAPVAITPDELGDYWQDGKLNLAVKCKVNGVKIGDPIASVDMVFHFGQLIAHAAKTRDLSAGTIIGSGTVSNRDANRGSSCLLEKRMLEILNNGKAITSYLKAGDIVEIDVLGNQSENIFGQIKQKVVKV